MTLARTVAPNNFGSSYSGRHETVYGTLMVPISVDDAHRVRQGVYYMNEQLHIKVLSIRTIYFSIYDTATAFTKYECGILPRTKM